MFDIWYLTEKNLGEKHPFDILILEGVFGNSHWLDQKLFGSNQCFLLNGMHLFDLIGLEDLIFIGLIDCFLMMMMMMMMIFIAVMS